MAWESHDDIGPDRTVHVWPSHEPGHFTDVGDPVCWCGPRLEEGLYGVAVHHRDQLDRLELAT